MKQFKPVITSVALIAAMASFAGNAFAQCTVAVLNLQEAVMGSSEGKAKAAAFDARVKGWTAKIDNVRTEIIRTQRDLDGQQGRLTPSAIDQLKQKISEMNTQLRQIQTDAQKDVDAFRDSLLIPIKTTANAIAKQVASEKGIESVADSSDPTAIFPRGGDPACDITSEVKSRMDAKYRAEEPGK